MKNLRIVFMGTPDFAAGVLGCLLVNGFNVAGVVTAPDKPAGRGRKIQKPPVKIFAEQFKLNILQPLSLKDPSFIAQLKELNADVFIIVAFRMLPEMVWKIPPIGTINLHASLLPDYRGAAPINHVIINGEKVTGVTTFFINDRIDTGNILLKEEVQIFPFDSAADLHDRLMKHGSRLLVRTLGYIACNGFKTISQEELINPGRVLKTAPKIFPPDCIINWNKDASTVHNLIRGLSPHPAARSFFIINGVKMLFKIFEGFPEIEAHDHKPATIISDGKKSLKIACSDGFINVTSLQPEGRSRMSADDFLHGCRITDFTISV
jgi:methionyl-tRNA formyltransferase